MVQASDPIAQAPPAAAQVERGSYFKGIVLSLVFQGVAGLTGSVVYAWSDVNAGTSARAKDVTQVVGFVLAIFYGFTHWILALPLFLRWRRRGESRSARGLSITSILVGSPSFFCLASALIGFAWDAWDHIKH